MRVLSIKSFSIMLSLIIFGLSNANADNKNTSSLKPSIQIISESSHSDQREHLKKVTLAAKKKSKHEVGVYDHDDDHHHKDHKHEDSDHDHSDNYSKLEISKTLAAKKKAKHKAGLTSEQTDEEYHETDHEDHHAMKNVKINKVLAKNTMEYQGDDASVTTGNQMEMGATETSVKPKMKQPVIYSEGEIPKGFGDNVSPEIRDELADFKKKYKELMKEKRALYDGLSDEAKEALKKERHMKKKHHHDKRKDHMDDHHEKEMNKDQDPNGDKENGKAESNGVSTEEKPEK